MTADPITAIRAPGTIVKRGHRFPVKLCRCGCGKPAAEHHYVAPGDAERHRAWCLHLASIRQLTNRRCGKCAL